MITYPSVTRRAHTSKAFAPLTAIFSFFFFTSPSQLSHLCTHFLFVTIWGEVRFHFFTRAIDRSDPYLWWSEVKLRSKLVNQPLSLSARDLKTALEGVTTLLSIQKLVKLSSKSPACNPISPVFFFCFQKFFSSFASKSLTPTGPVSCALAHLSGCFEFPARLNSRFEGCCW